MKYLKMKLYDIWFFAFWLFASNNPVWYKKVKFRWNEFDYKLITAETEYIGVYQTFSTLVYVIAHYKMFIEQMKVCISCSENQGWSLILSLGTNSYQDLYL